jgi:hypothetical protein
VSSTFSFSQVLGTVRHGVGHEDAAGALTSAGTPLWFIRGCSPQHTSSGGREDKKRLRGQDHGVKTEKCKRTQKLVSLSPVLGTVRHGDGHQDAAGVLTSAGAPLWFIRGCSPQHTSCGGRVREVKDHEVETEKLNVINNCDITRV